jgi:hypothetical protein
MLAGLESGRCSPVAKDIFLESLMHRNKRSKEVKRAMSC